MYVRSVCAWCGRLMSITEYDSGDKDDWRTSYSICPECREKLLENLEYAFCRRIRVLLMN